MILQIVDLFLQLIIFLGQTSDIAATIIENVVELCLELEYSSFKFLIFSCYSLYVLLKIFSFLGQLFVLDL